MASQAGFVVEVLGNLEPAAVIEVEWARRIRVAAYVGAFDAPEELVVSVRCVVFVDGQVVVCHDADGGCDILPGGRREDGETYIETACREIHEETGWRLDPGSLEPIGLIHLQNLGAPLPPYPYPHGLHLVYRGAGTELTADGWRDTEGQVLRSELVRPEVAVAKMSENALGEVFLVAASSDS